MQNEIVRQISSEVRKSQQLANHLRRHPNDRQSSIHDFRVSLRKVQASANILKSIENKPEVSATLKKVKRLLKATSKIRDEQVLQQILRQANPHHRSFPSDSVGELPIVLQKNALGTLSHVTPLVRSAQFHQQTRVLIEKKCKQLRSMAKKVKKHEDDAHFLHRYRIRAKKLRYILELLDSELAPPLRALKSDLKKTQADFGKVHDYDRAIQILKSPSLVFSDSERKQLKKYIRIKRDKLIASALQTGQQLAKKLSKTQVQS